MPDDVMDQSLKLDRQFTSGDGLQEIKLVRRAPATGGDQLRWS